MSRLTRAEKAFNGLALGRTLLAVPLNLGRTEVDSPESLPYHPRFPILPRLDKLEREHPSFRYKTKRRLSMGVVNPLTKEKASLELQDTFEKLAARAGKVPNIFAVMAHRPAVLNTFLPLYKAVISDGTVGAKYKELAYLRASMVNGCEYCTRAHLASSKGAGVTAEQIAALPFYKRSTLFDA